MIYVSNNETKEESVKAENTDIEIFDAENIEVESVDAEEVEDDTKNRKKGVKHVIKTVMNIIEWIIMICAVILLVYIFASTTSGRAANLFGTSILHVVTGSMEPTINVDDFVIVKKTDVNNLKEKDIIAFYSENPDTKGLMVIHRIIQINEDGSFVTKGDANTVADAVSVTPDKVIGKYTGKAWFLNWLVSFVSLRKLLLILVIIPMFFVSIYEVKTLAKLFKAETRGGGDESETEEERIERLKKEAIEEYKKEHEVEEPATESGDAVDNSEIDELLKKYGVDASDENEE